MRSWALFCLLASPAWAQGVAPDPAVYTCHVYVTGSDARNRPAAMERCVQDVLVKLSGDASVADTPVPSADNNIEDFAYLDLMSDMPIHDEQGTRDRPFEMIGHVRTGMAADLLHATGRSPWTGTRPRMLLMLLINRDGQRHILTGDNPQDERQRRALFDASERFAMPIRFPSAISSVTFPMPPLTAITGPLDPDFASLNAEMSWNGSDFAWHCAWTLYAGPGGDLVGTWDSVDDSFDAAFRSGTGGAAKRMAR